MSVNAFMDIAQQLTGNATAAKPAADHTEQAQVGLDFAKRQAERTPVETPKIPTLGAAAVAS